MSTWNVVQNLLLISNFMPVCFLSYVIFWLPTTFYCMKLKNKFWTPDSQRISPCLLIMRWYGTANYLCFIEWTSNLALPPHDCFQLTFIVWNLIFYFDAWLGTRYGCALHFSKLNSSLNQFSSHKTMFSIRSILIFFLIFYL